MATFESAYKIVQGLVEDFKANEKYHLSKEYQEAEVRKYYIDKFFMALGWDVLHDDQKNPYEQEVKVERGVMVSGAQKRADYSFSVKPNYNDTKFFVEAKKPSVNLSDPDFYFQTIRYGWHKATPLAVLTDFKEFHVLDSRFSPDINTILKRQHLRFHYSEYLDEEKFAQIYWLFSREAVESNSIEKVAASLPQPKGKAFQKTLFAVEKHQTIDDAFLEMIDDMRESLAKAFKKKDDSLNSEELTEATQKTIDRLVFIRFLEDKLIEQTHYVSEFGDKHSAWEDFVSVCRTLDAKYNGIVFKKSFLDEKEFKGPVDIEFRTICQDICHLNSRFLYNEIPIHILGSIYERFLGKVVHATDKRVKLELKPEVKNAGGVFYTPKPIVDYIVQHTVIKLIEGKTPEQIANLRFADIACGSGSFLIAVFDVILQYHNKYYQNNPAKAKKDGCLFQDGIWVLSIRQKQKILRNNIFGTDVDSQAVEVTQLSLALKLLEDETTATANEMMVFFHEKIIPDMTKNVICGNSLVETDIYMGNMFAGEAEQKLNPMDYKTAFPAIMKTGFDCIVGNPPYVVLEGEFRDDALLTYLKGKFKSASYKIDLYHLFFEKSILLLKKDGVLGFITPSNYLSANGLIGMRNFILANAHIEELNVITGKVFKNASVDTTISIFSRGSSKNKSEFIKSTWEANTLEAVDRKAFNQDVFKKNTGQVFIGTSKIKLNVKTFALGERFNVNFGMQLRDRKKFVADVILDSETSKITKDHRPCYTGKDISPYYTSYSNHLAYFNTKAKKGGCWDLDVHNANPKILVRQIGEVPMCSLDERGYCCLNAMFMITAKNEDEPYKMKFILGIMNSSFVAEFWKNNFSDMRKTFPKIKGTYLEKIPIPLIDLKDKEKKTLYTKLCQAVDAMLDAKLKYKTAVTHKETSYLDRKVADVQGIINSLVNELYGVVS